MADKQTNYKTIHYAHNTHNHLNIDAKMNSVSDGYEVLFCFFLLSFGRAKHRIFLLLFLFRPFQHWFCSLLLSIPLVPTLDYDKTICFIIVYQYGDLYCIYLPCFPYLVQASTVNFKAYSVCTYYNQFLIVFVSECLLCMQGAFRQSAKL